MDAQERKWQRESDAQTLAEADVISSTPKRLQGAVRAAKSMAKKQTQQVNSLKKVATRKITPRKRPARPAQTAKAVSTRRNSIAVNTNTRTSLSISKKRNK